MYCILIVDRTRLYSTSKKFLELHNCNVYYIYFYFCAIKCLYRHVCNTFYRLQDHVLILYYAGSTGHILISLFIFFMCSSNKIYLLELVTNVRAIKCCWYTTQYSIAVSLCQERKRLKGCFSFVRIPKKYHLNQ